MRLARLQEKHVASAVEVHLRAFPGFFLSFLGARFLREFYGGFLDDPTAAGVVAEDEYGSVRGIIVGTGSPNGFFRRLLLRRWWAFAFASLAAILRRPFVIGRLLRALWYRGDSPMADEPRGLLSSIAVDPEVQGEGLGSSLVKEWLAEMRRKGASGCYLLTDSQGNDATNRFYQRLGWRLDLQVRTPRGRILNRYLFDFPSSQGSTCATDS